MKSLARLALLFALALLAWAFILIVSLATSTPTPAVTLSAQVLTQSPSTATPILAGIVPGTPQQPTGQSDLGCCGATPAQPGTLVPDTGWTLVRAGLERRVINLRDTAGALVERLYLLRLEPAGYEFQIGYHAKQPQSLDDWQAETKALLVVNGGYYRREAETFLPAGLLIVNGQVIGYSYGAFAGMLAVTPQGPELRWLQQQPYTPGEMLRAGLQSFPLLIKPGGVLGFPAQYEDGRKARRTVIGQDRAGRILFLIADHDYFTLHQLSAYLADSDLDLDIALNLDGGPSSGLLLADPNETIPTFSVLPIVITVHPR